MKSFKKIMALVLAAGMVFCMGGCGSTGSASGSSGNSSTGATSTAKTDSEKVKTVEVSGKPTYEYTEGEAIKQIKERGKMIVGIDSGFVPFCFTDPVDNKSYGVNVAVAERLAECLGVDIEIVSESFAAVLSDLSIDSIDLCACMVVNTDERAKVMDFSKSIRKGYDYLLVKSENADEYNSKDKLSGKILTANNGSVQLSHAQEISDASVVACESVSDAVLQVISGTADAAVVSDANGLLYELGFHDQVKMVKDVSWEANTSSLAVNKGDSDLLDLLNQIIETEIAPNADELVEKYTQIGVEKLGIK